MVFRWKLAGKKLQSFVKRCLQGMMDIRWSKIISCRKENVAKYEARLRCWQTPETDGDVSQMPCLSNGTKGYTAVAAAATA
jgi:hypothetical protein